MDRRLAGLAAVVAALSAVYLFAGLGPRWDFVLPLRATRLAGMLLVGIAVAVSTVLFQTVTHNRILTPQIMGFDALYVLLQTGLVFALGLTGFAALPVSLRFGSAIAVMVAASLLLFGTLLGRRAQDIPRLILTGVILGVLFRSGSGLMVRVMDPNAYAVVQSVTMASFTRVDAALLPVAASLTAGAAALAWAMAARLDVLALGRPLAVSLGLAHDRLVLAVLALIAVLVSVSTAMVGPMTFLGLIVVALARLVAAGETHRRLLPAAALVACLLLVGGQLVFERLLALQATLGVVIEFAGGLVFLGLLLKGRLG